MLYTRVAVMIVIDQPVERVFNYITDAATHPLWQSDVTQATLIPSGPVQVGSVYHYTTETMGQRKHSTMRVIQLRRNSRCVMDSNTAPYAIETAFDFVAVGDATRLTITTQMTGNYPPSLRNRAEEQIRDLLQARADRIKQQLELSADAVLFTPITARQPLPAYSGNTSTPSLDGV